ncbi:hypothetical protein J2754_001480 [Halarchaeum solikamskense]|nr:hypothetical protein [Halarchaeum solikamskense]
MHAETLLAAICMGLGVIVPLADALTDVFG